MAPTTPFGLQPTLAIDVPFPFAAPVIVKACATSGLKPVFVWDCALSAKASPADWLQSLDAELRTAESTDPWGASATGINDGEELASLALAGFSHFSISLASSHSRPADMSLNELDAAIVALEDNGTYPLGWHEHYIDKEFVLDNGGALRFPDETLARIAVKFGPALSQLSEFIETIRTCWTGRGQPPDLDVAFEKNTSALEHLFVGLELRRRGHTVSSISPSLGLEPGLAEIPVETLAGFGTTLATHAAITRFCGGYKPGIQNAAYKPGLRAQVSLKDIPLHLNATGIAWLEALRVVVRHAPTLFHELLLRARDIFPTIRQTSQTSLSEEDVRHLPQPEPTEYETVFLNSWQGHQLLLATSTIVLEDTSTESFFCRIESILREHQPEYLGLIEAQIRALAEGG